MIFTQMVVGVVIGLAISVCVKIIIQSVNELQK